MRKNQGEFPLTVTDHPLSMLCESTVLCREPIRYSKDDLRQLFDKKPYTALCTTRPVENLALRLFPSIVNLQEEFYWRSQNQN